MNWGWWRVRRIALLARAHTARRLARPADDVGLRFWLCAMRDWVARIVLGVRCPSLPFAFLIEANPLGEAARLLVTLHKVNVTSQHQVSKPVLVCPVCRNNPRSPVQRYDTLTAHTSPRHFRRSRVTDAARAR